MPENVSAWWARRQRSKGVLVPYPVGSYRDEWERYPVLIRQYHPDLNQNITLTQVPPAADVYLTWQCDVGHIFVATPQEQRNRPGKQRRRSSWCPDCSALAQPKRVRAAPNSPNAAAAPQATAGRRPITRSRTRLERDEKEPLPIGEAFFSGHAPATASAAEADLRQRLAETLAVDLTLNAVRVGRPFYSRLEVWPDIVIPELRVALEYDTVGRFGLEHVGPREASDRRKDRLLRAAGWEVVRIRCGKLQPIGPYDLTASAVNDRLIERVLDALRLARGDLFVNAYLS